MNDFSFDFGVEYSSIFPFINNKKILTYQSTKNFFKKAINFSILYHMEYKIKLYKKIFSGKIYFLTIRKNPEKEEKKQIQNYILKITYDDAPFDNEDQKLLIHKKIATKLSKYVNLLLTNDESISKMIKNSIILDNKKIIDKIFFNFDIILLNNDRGDIKNKIKCVAEIDDYNSLNIGIIRKKESFLGKKEAYFSSYLSYKEEASKIERVFKKFFDTNIKTRMYISTY